MKQLLVLASCITAGIALTQCTSPKASQAPLMHASASSSLEADIAGVLAEGLRGSSPAPPSGRRSHATLPHEYIPPRPPQLYYDEPSDAHHDGGKADDAFPHPSAYLDSVYD